VTKKLTPLAIAVVLVFTMLFIVACGGDEAITTTTAASASTDTTAGTAATTAPASTDTTAPTGEVKTLKIGYAGWLGFFLGLDTLNGLQVVFDMVNEQGGLKVGDDTYKLELVYYDTNNDQATAQAVANKLIFQDKVQFIVWTDFFLNAILPLTEENKVMVVGSDLSGAILNPDYKYCFNTGIGNSTNAVYVGWFADTYPDKENVIMALTDDATGRPSVDIFAPVFATFGFNITNEFFPASATDLSSLGTKIKTANPDVLMCVGQTFQPYAAARQAGYEGIEFNPAPSAVATIVAQLGDAALVEGFMSGATPLEFEPALTDCAQTFKDAWVAENGAWEAPEVSGLCHIYALMAALQKAGSVDVESVVAALNAGLEFDTPMGAERMIARPDVGNTRTVDAIQAIYIKQVTNGEAELLATIPVEDSVAYFERVYNGTGQ
jgi:branched-chain amino acid transport system substrate-binding protein